MQLKKIIHLWIFTLTLISGVFSVNGFDQIPIRESPFIELVAPEIETQAAVDYQSYSTPISELTFGNIYNSFSFCGLVDQYNDIILVKFLSQKKAVFFVSNLSLKLTFHFFSSENSEEPFSLI